MRAADCSTDSPENQTLYSALEKKPCLHSKEALFTSQRSLLLSANKASFEINTKKHRTQRQCRQKWKNAHFYSFNARLLSFSNIFTSKSYVIQFIFVILRTKVTDTLKFSIKIKRLKDTLHSMWDNIHKSNKKNERIRNRGASEATLPQ